MRTVELDGGTVTLRERADVKVRQRQMMESASVVAAPAIGKIPRVEGKPGEIDWDKLDEAGLNYDEIESLQQLSNVAILALLVDWTFPEPIPRTLDDVLEMPADRFEELKTAVRAIGADVVTDTNFDPVSPKDPGFADSPTHGSTGSDGGSRDAEASPSVTATAGF